MNKLHILILFLVASSNVNSQINNGNFEIWDSLYACQTSYELDSIAESSSSIGGIPEGWTYNSDIGVCRTEDKVNGSYSIAIGTWYKYVSTNLTTVAALPEGSTHLVGYYKSIVEFGTNKDSIASCQINWIDNTGTIHQIKKYLESSDEFIEFSIPIDNIQADSISIQFRNSDETCITIKEECDYLFLDDLKFETISFTKNTIDEHIYLFPNPISSEILHVKNIIAPHRITIRNTNGQNVIIDSVSQFKNFVDIDKLRPGLYFVKLSESSNSKIVNNFKLIVSK